MKAIGLSGSDNESQAIVGAQLLDRFTQRGLPVSVCLGIGSIEDANLLHLGGGELWRVGAGSFNPDLVAHVDRLIDIEGDWDDVINRVDQAIEQFVGKTQVAA